MDKKPIVLRWEFWLIIGLCTLAIVLITGGLVFGWQVKDNGLMTYCPEQPSPAHSMFVFYEFTGDSKEEAMPCSGAKPVGLNPEQRPWAISTGPTLQLAAQRAADALSDQVGCKLFTVGKSKDAVVFISKTAAETGSIEGGDTSHILQSGQWSAIINIYNLVLVDELHRGLMHELGHALGLAHDPFKDSLMYKGTSGTTRLTDGDRKLLNARYCHANR